MVWSRRVGSALFSSMVIASAAVVVGGCASDYPANVGSSEGNTPSNDDVCGVPNVGCPCADPGSVVACGRVERSSGTYLSCSEGKRTCTNGTWGDCVGDAVVTRTVPVTTLRLSGLGASTPCTSNPCDPACQNFVDTPAGLDAGAGFAVTEAGVQLSGSYGDAGPSCTGMTVTPSPTTLTVTNMTASNTKQLTADLTPAACYAGTVSALWTVDKFDISQINSSGLLNLITPIAGPIIVNAYAGTLSASPTTVNVVVNVYDNSAAPGGYAPQTTWTGAAGAADPLEILYPYAGTMLPLGLLPPTIQWRNGGTAANAAMITLRYPSTGTAIFTWSKVITETTTSTVTNGTAVTPTAQPRAIIPQSVWFAFEQTVARNRATSGDTGLFGITRHYGGAVHPEVTRTIRFADGQLKGKIYYNSYGTNLVKNFGPAYNGTDRFGAATLVIPPGASAPSVAAGYDSASNGPGCRACHSVSPNGNVLESLKDNYDAVSYDLTQSTLTETAIGSAGKYAWPAFAPDGSYLLSDASSLFGTTNTKSVLYNLNGTAIGGTATVFTSNFRAGTPAFNGNASKLVFNFYGGTPAPVTNPSSGITTGDKKTLSMMDFNPTTKVFSNFVNLHTPASGYAVWPSFLPVGQDGVVFEREIITSRNGGWGITRSNCDSKDAACNKTGATAELWWVNTTGTIQAAALANANGVSLPTGPALHGSNSDGEYTGNDGNTPANNVTTANFNDAVYNYEPTALPIQAGGYSWVAFTSRRMYGNIATINPYYSDPRYRDISTQPTPKKIWITAISSSPTPGTDPSFPAFYLPGQELLAGNARAYFALDACKVAGAPSTANVCETDLDCCGGTAMPKTAVCSLDTPLASPPVRHCVAVGASTCSADGAACSLDSQCCNFGTGSRCSSFTCQTPPPIITYSSANFEREFTSTCGVGKRVAWRFYDWQSITPNGTSITFTAATKDVGGAYGPEVAIGVSAPPPNQTATWTSGALTVDDALKASGQVSKPVLRVTAIFTPKTVQPSATPTLTQWRQSYDCVDSE